MSVRKSSGGSVEEISLAEARAAIRWAASSRNSTSTKAEGFIPRGGVYRNAYAFHQYVQATRSCTFLNFTA